jgi:hypothetical protein
MKNLGFLHLPGLFPPAHDDPAGRFFYAISRRPFSEVSVISSMSERIASAASARSCGRLSSSWMVAIFCR